MKLLKVKCRTSDVSDDDIVYAVTKVTDNVVPVYYPISAQDKMRIEAPYHALCNAGHIGYVEVDGDLTKNPQALEALVKYAADLEMNYFSINHPVDMCPVCGYVDVIGDQCPRCGFTEQDGVTIEHLKSCGCGEALKRIEK